MKLHSLGATEAPPQHATVVSPPRIGIGGTALIVVVAVVFAILADVLPGSIHFADDAVRRAGENPPTKVALQLESLRRWQGVGNTTFLLACMGGSAACLFSAAMRFLPPGSKRGFVRATLAVFMGTIVGGVAGAMGWLFFRLRPMGDQSLIVATLIQALVWGILGLGVGMAIGGLHRSRAASLTTAVLICAMWGVLAPAVLTIAFPSSYVGTVIPAERTARLLWGTAGGLVLTLGVLRSGLIATLSPASAAIPKTEGTPHPELI